MQGILTPVEMRKIILQNGGSVAWQGQLITRENLDKLPTQADYAAMTGEGIDATKASLESQIEDLKSQLTKLAEAKDKPKEVKEKTKVKKDEVSDNETSESPLLSSKPAGK